ncbi:hypothetical protein [Microbacterium sp. CJ88]|uniref:hypothetical protein n=1 Tax=Microbacterium sp. CJ88 TaxID=3445672 RepID=UPI003F65ED8B
MALGVSTAPPQRVTAAEAAPARFTASWPTLVAWGAGLLQFALGAGLITAGGDVWPRVIGIALVVLGATGLVWGAVTLARGRIVVPRAGVAGSLVGIVAVFGAMAIDPAHTSIAAVGASVLLSMVLGGACGLRTRRDANDGTDASEPVPARIGIVGMLVGALLVSALVTPALSLTEAGRLAPDHSSHDLVFNQHSH